MNAGGDSGRAPRPCSGPRQPAAQIGSWKRRCQAPRFGGTGAHPGARGPRPRRPSGALRGWVPPAARLPVPAPGALRFFEGTDGRPGEDRGSAGRRRRARGERGEEAGGGAGGGGAPIGGVRPGTGCHPAAVSLCHRSGLLATAASPAARPEPRAPSRRCAPGSSPPGAPQPHKEAPGPPGGTRARREGAEEPWPRSPLAPRKDARCRGSDTSGKLLEMAPAAATAGDAKPGRALAPAGLLSGRADRGPRGAVPALRPQLGLEKFLHAAFVTPPAPQLRPESRPASPGK